MRFSIPADQVRMAGFFASEPSTIPTTRRTNELEESLDISEIPSSPPFSSLVSPCEQSTVVGSLWRVHAREAHEDGCGW